MSMLKRILALALCLCLAAGMIPAAEAGTREPILESVDRCCGTLRVEVLAADYTRPAYDGYLIEITPQRVEDTFEYLDEVYIERHPEAALLVNTGDHRDQEMLLTLAQTITAGCTTDTEKANAIDSWLYRNIYYDVNTSAYASDTFLDRTGNCLSYANLMQFLLRSLGIPAVVGDGWRGDMKTSTVDLFNYEGHAWCFVYLEGEWALYDPLWLEGGTTDRDYIAEWIYLDTVEFVTPAYDGDNLPPEAYNKPKVYYTNGIWYNYNEGAEAGYGNFTQFVNNQGYNFTTSQDEWENDGPYDGWVYVDGRDETSMRMGEVYRNGWISYGDYNDGSHMLVTYAHINGMQIDGAVMELDGVKRYMQRNSTFPILADEEDYTIQYGLITFRSDYVGPFLAPAFGSAMTTDEYSLTWTSQNPEVATVDENGILTAVAPGYASIKLELVRVEDGALLSLNYTEVLISDEERVPDYTDHAPCEHSYALNGTVEATCTSWGYEIHICSLCGTQLELYTQEPLGHDYSVASVTPSTCISEGYTVYACFRCGDSFSESMPVDSEAHVWDGTECTLCGDTRLTPFDDVTEASFYEAPVAWAVENEITNGTSDTTFGSMDQCLRAHVVTFLWRAEGCPEPTSTENPFTDVSEKDWYYKAVMWAVEQGITTGTSATTFGPFGVCNRAQVVTFLHRAKGSPTPNSLELPFTDVTEGAWYAVPIAWAVENSITNGISPTEFGPDAACNRAQVVTFLYRAYVN